MIASTVSQDEAIAIAAQHDYRVETRRQTTGDHWEVRIYSTAEGYRVRSYDRRRDVAAADIPARILAMTASAVHGLPWETGSTLPMGEALDLLA